MENISRRQFLKLSALAAGMVTLAGCGAGGTKAMGGGTYKRPAGELQAKEWGMFIDMEKISESDIDAMQRACHKAHNVPNIPVKKNEVKWIWKENFENLFIDDVHVGLSKKYREKPFVTLCNHCAKPICVKVCPTQATFTNSQGIVMMDMHRCIGCRNCMAACPYGSRSFNFMDPRPYIDELNPTYPTRSKGVVEKCDLCSEHLAAGEQPVCAAMSKGGIVVGDLADPSSEINQLIAENMTLVRRPNVGTEPKVYYKVSLKGAEA